MSLDGELRHRAFELGKRRAVLVRGEIESIRGDKAAGARVVLHDDAGMAGNEAPEMAGDESGGNVVDAARRAADQHGDRASAIEPLNRLRRGCSRCEQRSEQAECTYDTSRSVGDCHFSA